MSMIEKLYQANNSNLKRYVSAMIRDKHIVEDICQEVWTRLSKACAANDLYSEEHGIRLMYTIGKNLGLKYITRRTPALTDIMCANAEPNTSESDDDGDNVKKGLWAKGFLEPQSNERFSSEDVAVLLEAVEQMPRKVKEVYNYLRAGHSTAEIGKILGVSESCVRMRWERYILAIKGGVQPPNVTKIVTLESNTPNRNTNVTL